jgi:hypothetical protein
MVAKYRSILVAGKRKKIMKEKKREVVFDLRIWWNRVVLIEMESELPQKIEQFYSIPSYSNKHKIESFHSKI